MAKSKITGKTFEEMLSESIELDLSAKFKDIIYEFISDVHAMGMVVYSYQEGNSKFLFKDSSFKKPVTDNELLAMYLDEVVATRLVDEDTALERCRDLENEKVQYYEYKDGNFIKRFYKIGEYYSGETYNDLNGFVPGGMPLVGTAIVGVDKVAEDEPVLMQTIWEGTFDAESSGGPYGYETPNVQNGELIKNCNEVTVTFDGISYVLPVNKAPFGFVFGDETLNDIPFIMAFGFHSESHSDIEIVRIMTKTEGSHTLKVEGTPVEPVIKVLIPETTFTKGSNDLYHFDGIQTFDDESIKITLNGTDYYASIDNEDTELGNIDYQVEDENISIYLYSYATAVSIVPSGVTIEINDENSGVEHEYTIKVETTDETPIVVPGGGAVVINPQG